MSCSLQFARVGAKREYFATRLVNENSKVTFVKSKMERKLSNYEKRTLSLYRYLCKHEQRPDIEYWLINFSSKTRNMIREWDRTQEQKAVSRLRGYPQIGVDEQKLAQIKEQLDIAKDGIMYLPSLEKESKIGSGTSDRLLLVFTRGLRAIDRYFQDEENMLYETAELAGESVNSFRINAVGQSYIELCMKKIEELKKRLEKIQERRSVGYRLDFEIVIALCDRYDIRKHIMMFVALWGYIHETEHDLEDLDKDLIEGTFNYVLLSLALSLPDHEVQRKFIRGYLLTDDSTQKEFCKEVIKNNQDFIHQTRERIKSLKCIIQKLTTKTHGLTPNSFSLLNQLSN
jgi:hypothetical protein